MEFFRAGEAIIRSSQSLLLPFLTPNAERATARIGATSISSRYQQYRRLTARRTFASSCQNFSPSSVAAESQEEQAGSTRTTARRRNSDDEISAIFDRQLDKTPSPRASPRPSNSVDDVLADLGKSRPRTRDTSTPSSQSDLGSMDVRNILSTATPAKSAAPSATPARSAASWNEPAPVKLNSTTGRIIRVDADQKMDVARAFRVLGSRLAQNNVRRDFQRQKFHERPGLKRKRLKSERWRKRFKTAFQSTVQRVVDLKRQGW